MTGRHGRAYEFCCCPSAHFQCYRQRRNGQLVPVSLALSPIRSPEGTIVGVSTIARDISAQLVTERAALRLAAIVESSEDAIVSKDLNSIVTGKIRLAPMPVDLLHVARAAADVVRPSMESKSLTFTLTTDGQPLIAMADADRLQQAFWNILTNAVKFTPEGGSVRMDLSCVNQMAHIVVSDTGIGISPDFLPHMFERFRQFESGARREYGGLGLGLSLVRYFVELHGGTVAAESEGPGKGSTFRITLPLAVSGHRLD